MDFASRFRFDAAALPLLSPRHLGRAAAELLDVWHCAVDGVESAALAARRHQSDFIVVDRRAGHFRAAPDGVSEYDAVISSRRFRCPPWLHQSTRRYQACSRLQEFSPSSGASRDGAV